MEIKKELELVLDNQALELEENKNIQTLLVEIRDLEKQSKILSEEIANKKSKVFAYLNEKELDKAVFLDMNNKFKASISKTISTRKVVNVEKSENIVYDIKEVSSQRLTINDIE